MADGVIGVAHVIAGTRLAVSHVVLLTRHLLRAVCWRGPGGARLRAHVLVQALAVVAVRTARAVLAVAVVARHGCARRSSRCGHSRSSGVLCHSRRRRHSSGSIRGRLLSGMRGPGSRLIRTLHTARRRELLVDGSVRALALIAVGLLVALLEHAAAAERGQDADDEEAADDAADDDAGEGALAQAAVLGGEAFDVVRYCAVSGCFCERDRLRGVSWCVQVDLRCVE